MFGISCLHCLSPLWEESGCSRCHHTGEMECPRVLLLRLMQG